MEAKYIDETKQDILIIDGTRRIVVGVDHPRLADILNGTTIQEPDLPALAVVVADKTRELAAAAEAFLEPYAREYGTIERDSWPTQVAEATAYTEYLAALETDPNATVPATPWLDGAGAARGMDKATFAARILAKPAVWAAIQGAVCGQRLAYQDQVDAIAAGEGTEAEKVTAIQAIMPEFTLPG